MLTIYSKNNCPYCTKAKLLFDDLEIPYQIIDISEYTDVPLDLEKKTGRTTVPQIFKDDKFIGGYLDIEKMQNEGTLLKNLNFNK